MKKISLILLGLIFAMNVSAQVEGRILHLSGYIADKYPINMTLTFNGDKVLGYYFYEKYKTKILLEGQIDDNKMTLNEASDDDFLFDSEFKKGFIGDFKGESFSGVWTDKDNDKTLDFSVFADLRTFSDIPKNILEMEGTYEYMNDESESFGSVDLRYVLDDLFCFKIIVETGLGCTGYIKGLIELKDLTHGLYSYNSCEKLEIQLLDNELLVSETACFDFHGMNCSFDGKYKKVESEEVER